MSGCNGKRSDGGPFTGPVIPRSEFALKLICRAPILATLTCLFILCFRGIPALGQAPGKPDEAKPAAHAADAHAQEKPAPEAPAEKTSITHHSMVLRGQTIHYTATAGMLLIRDNNGKPNGSFFYVSYTLDGAGDQTSRPVTFLYNGGPGSSSMWLHMGAFGPVRVETDSPKATGPAPYKTVDNPYTLLDRTDLIFVDAIGTGFSRPAGGATQKDFSGVDQDVRSFNQFISRYLTVYQRWNSPKFLFGESYGTTRSAMLVDALQAAGIECNGVILMSSILNYGIRDPGYDRLFIGYLPSYAAIAYYHNKLPQKPASLAGFLTQVRAYARGPYAEALAQGDALSKQQQALIAARLSAFTGLSVRYLEQANLRVTPTRFRKELLRGDEEMLGRYDARFEGTDEDAAGETPGYDPSEAGVTGAFVSALHEYLAHNLGFQTEETYLPTDLDIVRMWDWKHRGPDGVQQLPDAAQDLADAMRKNPKLRVFSANGLFDLATPFFVTEFDLAHMSLAPQLRSNVQLAYYPSGHMIYLNEKALQQFSDDLDGFYQSTAAR